jgi:DNA-directed RNA polymerase subunit B
MWPIIHDILRREGVARQHLNSYNEFTERGFQSIIDEVGEIEIETAEYPYKIKLGKIKNSTTTNYGIGWIYNSCCSCRSKIA